MIKLVYIGEDFYWLSGSIMSMVYQIQPIENGTNYIRYDWGLLRADLARGTEVHIRAAIPDELDMFKKRLERIIGEKNKDA